MFVGEEFAVFCCVGLEDFVGRGREHLFAVDCGALGVADREVGVVFGYGDHCAAAAPSVWRGVLLPKLVIYRQGYAVEYAVRCTDALVVGGAVLEVYEVLVALEVRPFGRHLRRLYSLVVLGAEVLVVVVLVELLNVV